MDPVPWLPSATNELIEQAARALSRALGDRHQSTVLVGAAMNPTRFDRGHAPEILAITSIEARELWAIAAELHAPMKRGARIRLISQHELERSSDVFALEVAEWKVRHYLLAGTDPFAPIVVDRADLRRSIELELRGLSRRIKNRVLTGLATKGERDDARVAVGAGYDTFLVAAYHAIVVFGDEPPDEEPAIISDVAKRCRSDGEAFTGQLATLRSGGKVDVVRALEELLTLTLSLTDEVDAYVVAP